MSSKLFAITKEQLAAGVVTVADAAGGAQCAQVYQIPKKEGGRDMELVDAKRIVDQVSLGKQSILFRLGNHPGERAGVIDHLSDRLKREKDKAGQRRVPFNKAICKCIAAAAIDELAIEQCFTCHGSGVMRDHDIKDLEGRQPMKTCTGCMGAKRRRYNEDERVTKLAETWIGVFPAQPLYDPAAVSIVAHSLRKHPRLREILAAIDYAKGLLLEAERDAVQETGVMLERLEPT